MLGSLRDWPTLRLSAHPCPSNLLKDWMVCGWRRGSFRASFYEVLRYVKSERLWSISQEIDLCRKRRPRSTRNTLLSVRVAERSSIASLLTFPLVRWKRGICCLSAHPPRALRLLAHLSRWPGGSVGSVPLLVNTAKKGGFVTKTTLLGRTPDPRAEGVCTPPVPPPGTCRHTAMYPERPGGGGHIQPLCSPSLLAQVAK